jgi:hypothetical protein
MAGCKTNDSSYGKDNPQLYLGLRFQPVHMLKFTKDQTMFWKGESYERIDKK